jgi:uncharacterized membrane protein (DUF106 family)
MGFLDTLLDPILNPLLKVKPLWSIIIISLLISLVVTIVYKLVTNQDEMKRLKSDLKEQQKKMRESKDNPEAVLSMQKQLMSKNMEYMKHSFKPTLITFIPIIIIFGWLQAHLAFVPIIPGDQFVVEVNFDPKASGLATLTAQDGLEIIGPNNKTINSQTEFTINAVEEGDYFIFIDVNNKPFEKEVFITKQRRYSPQIKEFENEPVKAIKIQYDKLQPLGDVSIFGWNPGWLALYITFSLLFTIILRKAFKLH